MLKFDAYVLKWMAIIGMVLNHVVFALFEQLPFALMFPLYLVGGLTFPILGYFVVEGYKHTSNIKRYMLRLAIFGVIAQPFHWLVFRNFGLNILFTLILSLLVLVLHDKMKIRPLFWLVFVVLLIVSAVFGMDWAVIGPIGVLLTYRIKNEKARRIVPPIIFGIYSLGMVLFGMFGLWFGGPETMRAMYGEATIYANMEFWIVSSTTFIFGCIAAGILLLNHNDERGKKSKWLFYIMYPLHLAVLGGLAVMFGNFPV
ncbi:MAG: conjugal transfer protein TraX [Defluviitaleaceae bacterium]|nr:conjugal transfer protein TraX [Defluviitaleaceae bacterium]